MHASLGTERANPERMVKLEMVRHGIVAARYKWRTDV